MRHHASGHAPHPPLRDQLDQLIEDEVLNPIGEIAPEPKQRLLQMRITDKSYLSKLLNRQFIAQAFTNPFMAQDINILAALDEFFDIAMGKQCFSTEMQRYILCNQQNAHKTPAAWP
ncbi:hypothetical protein FHW96_002611 [Novosphingobium sp. SG751A]|uniref:hypothetical protein n=1 Tax=Novosphingobium sp. SG751A TaxID=2587000 RepID=UPI001554F821|nr:hypothetical protein [Novosphingobium sp. SG751A]NOW46451.1 hypothetical protein [Novosphingobium sp. SG751A]